MLRGLFRVVSLVISWLDAFFNTNKKLFPARLAHKHELNDLEITEFNGNHLYIGEGEYGQVYANGTDVLII